MKTVKGVLANIGERFAAMMEKGKPEGEENDRSKNQKQKNRTKKQKEGAKRNVNHSKAKYDSFKGEVI